MLLREQLPPRLKIREAPDAKAKEITFSKACVDGKEVEAKSVDKGTELIIYSRTKDMVKTVNGTTTGIT